MTRLWLRVTGPFEGDRLPPALYAELSGTGFKGSKSVMLPAGHSWYEESVGPGRYLLQTTLPSGQFVANDFEVGDGDDPKKVTVTIPTSIAQHLNWPHFLGSFRSDLSPQGIAARSAAFTLFRTRYSTDPFLSGTVRTHLRGIGEGGDDDTDRSIERGTMVSVELPGEGTSGPVTYAVRLETDQEGLAFLFEPSSSAKPAPCRERLILEIDAGLGEPWFASLPLPWSSTLDGEEWSRVDVVLHRAADISEDADPPRVAVIVRDQYLGPLLAYMSHGRLTAAAALCRQFLGGSQQILYRERPNPTAAAAYALVLLRMQFYEQLHRQAFDLADICPWLPDGAVAAGWSCLLGIVRPPDIEQARKYFIDAVRRGPPVLTDALRLQIAGLKRCLIDSESKKHDDPELRDALSRSRDIALTCDQTQIFTVWRGASRELLSLAPLKVKPASAGLPLPGYASPWTPPIPR